LVKLVAAEGGADLEFAEDQVGDVLGGEREDRIRAKNEKLVIRSSWLRDASASAG
jgi:hypothetical protein